MNEMNYKVYVETDSSFSICVGRFELFEDAKEQMERMIVGLFSKPKDDFYDDWEEFKEEFPEVIQMIISSYEEDGTVCFHENIEGITSNYHYVINKNVFEICDNENSEHEPSFTINTNTIRMNDIDDEYYFRLWHRASDESFVIRLEPVLIRLDDDIRARLGVLDYEDDEEL